MNYRVSWTEHYINSGAAAEAAREVWIFVILACIWVGIGFWREK